MHYLRLCVVSVLLAFATTAATAESETQQPRCADKVRVEMDIVFSGTMRGRTVEGRVKGVVQSEHTFSAITTAQAAVEP